MGCVVNGDCDGPTAQCVSNVCQDPSWGCLTEVDNRPAAVQAAATLTVKVTNAVTMQPLPMMTVHPCLDVAVDPTCAAAYPNASSTYDAASGTVTITGLQNGFPIHVEFLSGAAGDFMPLHYYSNRAARDWETVADLAMVPPTILSMLPTPVPFDVKKGLFTVRIHDCQGMPGAGLTVSMLNPPSDLITTYLSEAGAPRFDLTATTSAGAAGFLNVTPGSLTTIVVNISRTKTLRYQLAPIGGATSTIDLYPRIPATK